MRVKTQLNFSNINLLINIATSPVKFKPKPLQNATNTFSEKYDV